MPDRYVIAFTSAGLAYVRQALGARPYDEVCLLVQNLDQQRAEQDRPPPPPEQADDDAAPATSTVTPLRPRRARRAKPNGSLPNGSLPALP